MVTFLMISRHAPADCPMNNEKVKKTYFALAEKIGELTKKHGVKDVGSWVAMPEHLIVWVFEAPTSEAFQKFLMEPDMMKWIANNTTEIKMAMTLHETMKLLK